MSQVGGLSAACGIRVVRRVYFANGGRYYSVFQVPQNREVVLLFKEMFLRARTKAAKEESEVLWYTGVVKRAARFMTAWREDKKAGTQKASGKTTCEDHLAPTGQGNEGGEGRDTSKSKCRKIREYVKTATAAGGITREETRNEYIARQAPD